MSTTYELTDDYTFEQVSRETYGTETEALRIAQANPGVSEPLSSGTTLVIPAIPDAPQNIPQTAPSVAENEVAILIDGDRYRFWESVSITRSIDSMDTVIFTAPFDSKAPGFREMFRPMSFKTMTITVGGTPLFTGVLVTPTPVIEPTRITLSVNGYSLPGVLNDCTPPASAFPLESDGQGLRDIATTMAAPFGIGVEFLAEQGAVFERVACKPGRKVLSYLTDLAKQRNLVTSSSARGRLIFQQSYRGGKTVARLQQGSAPVQSITPFFNSQDYYSHVTGIDPVTTGFSGSQYTVKNPHLTGVTRPLTFNAPDTTDSDVKLAVDAKMGRMFGNMVSYTVVVATWRDPSGNLWEPNTSVKLLAPDAMIYNEYEFIIGSIDFTRNRAAETATLVLLLPGAFSGKIPEVLPWDE